MIEINAPSGTARHNIVMFDAANFFFRFRRAMLGLAAALLPALAVQAAQQPEWHAQITEEIWQHHNCRLSFLSHIVERPMKDGVFVMVKAHCEDNRSFDAVRDNRLKPFSFKECTPLEQQTC